MVEFPPVWARLLACLVFVVSFSVVFWYALVHTVHRGTLSVPDLQGLTVEQAQQRSHDLGLQISLEKPGVFSPDVPAGAIAQQEPYPGFHLKTGSTLKVRLSLGSERALIPNVKGESLQSALRGLERAGLRPGKRVQVMHNSGADLVIATDPPIGVSVAPSHEINLLVNVDPVQKLWVMPSLLSTQLTEVRRFCRLKHLRLGQVHEVTYPGLPSQIVLRQYPPAGSPLAPSDIITLWVSR